MSADVAISSDSSAITETVASAAFRARHEHPLRLLGRLLFNCPAPVWLALDAAVVWLAVVLGYRWFALESISHHVEPWLTYGVIAGTISVSSLIVGLHERATLVSRGRVLLRVLLTAALGAILTYAIIYVLLYMRLSRRVAALAFIMYFVCGTSLRLCACHAVHRLKRRLLFVGNAKVCEAFVERLEDGLLQAQEFVGYVHSPSDSQQMGTSRIAQLGTTRDIVRLCRKLDVKDIVVCNGSARNPEVMTWLLPALRLGCRVTNEATFYETNAGQILVDEITPEWFLFSDLKSHCDEYATLKRVFDIAVSVVGLFVSLPLYPLLALAIRSEDGGPVLYSQDRVGKNGQIFKLYKFRTMRTDAEDGRSVWASPNDPRVTRVGRLLRKARLDEFPQFYNTLVGQMSIVGPRPERPDLVAELREKIPYWSERNLVKPGLTGWAQISYRYGNSLADARRKLQYDFYYLKHMNLELDLIILLRTLGTFLRGAC